MVLQSGVIEFTARPEAMWADQQKPSSVCVQFTLKSSSTRRPPSCWTSQSLSLWIRKSVWHLKPSMPTVFPSKPTNSTTLCSHWFECAVLKKNTMCTYIFDCCTEVHVWGNVIILNIWIKCFYHQVCRTYTCNQGIQAEPELFLTWRMLKPSTVDDCG